MNEPNDRPVIAMEAASAGVAEVARVSRDAINIERKRIADQQKYDQEDRAATAKAREKMESDRATQLELHERQTVAWERIAAALETIARKP